MNNAPVLLITGALSGIGRATAFAFARDKARVVLAGRRAEVGELAKGLRATGIEAEIIQAHAKHYELINGTPAISFGHRFAYPPCTAYLRCSDPHKRTT
jgi:NAD(P)-dependent dehydrogenase (short-subunit alcohol dehydrogenase family)